MHPGGSQASAFTDPHLYLAPLPGRLLFGRPAPTGQGQSRAPTEKHRSSPDLGLHSEAVFHCPAGHCPDGNLSYADWHTFRAINLATPWAGC